MTPARAGSREVALPDTALATSAAIRAGRLSAVEAAADAFERIEALDRKINAFTQLTRERALCEAAAIDAKRIRGEPMPVLAGVPYAVKNLFDIKGVVTLAGSKINRDLPAASADAYVVRRMREAGAVLVGALNMDEYAFGFTTENTHYGPTRNPHAPDRIAGGSSGGSAAAVAAGMVPLTLGTDTNGSIRVPASLNGVFAVKPTYGRLSRAGSYPFVDSLDHVGPFARTVADLAACYDALQGSDGADPAQARKTEEKVSDQLAGASAGLRIAVAGGYFSLYAGPDARAVVALAARALDADTEVTLPEVERARAAAFVITAAEGSALHLADLRRRAEDFDPLIRDRFLANALTPAAWVIKAQRFRRWFHAQVMECFSRTDIILAAATPVSAPIIGTETLELNGVQMPSRPSMGLLTQPISFIGLPVVTVPVVRTGKLPLGLQIIAAPWREADAFRVAAALERAGVVKCAIADL